MALSSIRSASGSSIFPSAVTGKRIQPNPNNDVSIPSLSNFRFSISASYYLFLYTSNRNSLLFRCFDSAAVSHSVFSFPLLRLRPVFGQFPVWFALSCLCPQPRLRFLCAPLHSGNHSVFRRYPSSSNTTPKLRLHSLILSTILRASSPSDGVGL